MAISTWSRPKVPAAATSPFWKGRGDGTFAFAPVVSHLNFSAETPYFGDFDGDGRADIAAAGVSQIDSSKFAINRAAGQADGTYLQSFPDAYSSGAATTKICGTYETSVITGFVVAAKSGQYLDLFGVATNPRTLLGAGNSAGVGGCSVLSFDGNGSPLVRVSITQQSSLGSPMSSQLFVAGSNTMPSSPIFAFSDLASAWTILDFDHDGHLDIAAQSAGGSTSGIFWGATTAPFSTSTTFESYGQAAADFDADGNLDVMICGSGTCSIVFGDGARHFGRARAIPESGRVADVNNDCVPDLVIVHRLTGTNTSPIVLSVYLSAAGRLPAGSPDIECGSLPVDQCAGPTAF